MTLTNGRNHLFRNNLIVDNSTYYSRNALLVFGAGTQVLTNVFVRVNVETVGRGDSPDVHVLDNILCEGRITTARVTQSGNRFTYEGLPAPRRLRVVTTP